MDKVVTKRPAVCLARRAGYVLLAIFSFFVVAKLASFVIWDVSKLDEHDVFVQKIERAKEQMPLSALFIGASYIDGGVDSKTLDAEMSTYGHDFKSFNLGIGALSIVEMEAAVNEALKNRECCKYILLSPSFQLWVVAASSDNVRSINFFDLHRAFEQIRFMSSAPQIPNEPIDRQSYFESVLKSVFRHYTNIGLGSAVMGLMDFSPGYGNWKRYPTWDSHGYTKYPSTHNMNEHTKDYDIGLADMLHKESDFRLRAAADKQPVGERFVSRPMLDRLIRMGERIEAVGITPLILLPPLVGYWPWQSDLVVKFSAVCGDSHVLDFADPKKFPEIFALPARYDGGHLNANGAVVWTKLIAKKFSAMLEDGQLAGRFCLHSH